MQCSIFEDDESYVFITPQACSLLRSKGQASEIPSDAYKSHNLIGQ